MLRKSRKLKITWQESKYYIICKILETFDVVVQLMVCVSIVNVHIYICTMF